MSRDGWCMCCSVGGGYEAVSVFESEGECCGNGVCADPPIFVTPILDAFKLDAILDVFILDAFILDVILEVFILEESRD